jgi:hypothetical protein
MNNKLLKIFGITIVAVTAILLVFIILLKVYSPAYFVPYITERVSENTKGRYKLEINSDSVNLHLFTMSLNLGFTEFKRDSSVEVYSGIELLDKFDLHMTLGSFRISTFNVLRFLISKKIVIDEVSLYQPEIIIHKNVYYKPEEAKKLPYTIALEQPVKDQSDSLYADTAALSQMHQSRRAITPPIRIADFKIEDASFVFYDGSTENPLQEVHGLDFELQNFDYNKNHDIDVTDAVAFVDSASSLVSRNTARLKIRGLRMHPDSIHLDNLHFGHIVDRYQINRIKGFRASWLQVDLNDVEIHGLHPGSLISDSILNIDNTTIGSVKLYLFKDKEEMVINPAHKPLPSEQIRNISANIQIDTIKIEDGDFFIEMEASNAVVPGQLRISDFNGEIYNVSNVATSLAENPMMQFNSSFTIEDSIEVALQFAFDITSEENEYTASCDVQPFAIPTLNGFIGSQFFVEFPKGALQHFHFEFQGNNKVNVGTLDLEYEDLSVRKLQDYEKYIEGKPNTGFLAGVGNLIIPHNRNRNSNNYKPGVIYYEKEYNRDVVHCTIMSMVSGIASSVGLSSRNLEKQEEKASKLDEGSIQESAELAKDKAEKALEKKANDP